MAIGAPWQAEVIREQGVAEHIDLDAERERRIGLLLQTACVAALQT
ncbi:hypothetical protein [Caballeronia sp. LZ035]|nr:hypothetical protein [Caballeronia sp. LZ035]MDR5763461.1 hypothetical protein [Caballeronia sp. LZ035]